MGYEGLAFACMGRLCECCSGRADVGGVVAYQSLGCDMLCWDLLRRSSVPMAGPERPVVSGIDKGFLEPVYWRIGSRDDGLDAVIVRTLWSFQLCLSKLLGPVLARVS